MTAYVQHGDTLLMTQTPFCEAPSWTLIAFALQCLVWFVLPFSFATFYTQATIVQSSLLTEKSKFPGGKTACLGKACHPPWAAAIRLKMQGKMEGRKTKMFWEEQCQIMICLLNSRSVSIITERECFPRELPSISGKWADWIGCPVGKQKVGVTFLAFIRKSCISNNSGCKTTSFQAVFVPSIWFLDNSKK